MAKTISGLLIVVGLIHLLPALGALGPERLGAMYGVALQEPNLVILMRHRAVLFGLLGAFLVYAAFFPTLQPLALVAGAASVGSFLLIAWLVSGFNESIRKVVMIDALALVVLAIAGVLYALKSRQG